MENCVCIFEFFGQVFLVIVLCVTELPDMYNMETLSDRLSAAIAHGGFDTQMALAEKSGVPQASIHRIAHGLTKEPKLHTLAKLAAACGVELDWLRVGEGPMLRDAAARPDGGFRSDLFVGFAGRLTMLRNQLQLSTKEMAARIGISEYQYSTYETGEGADADFLMALAAIGIDVGYLLSGTRRIPPGMDSGEYVLTQAYKANDAKVKKLLVAAAMAVIPLAKQAETVAEGKRSMLLDETEAKIIDTYQNMTDVGKQQFLAIIEVFPARRDLTARYDA